MILQAHATVKSSYRFKSDTLFVEVHVKPGLLDPASELCWKTADKRIGCTGNVYAGCLTALRLWPGLSMISVTWQMLLLN